MSIANALSNALSGLTVASRSADIVSSNIANSMTEGYGVRKLEISSRIVALSGSGARVTGVTRQEDAILLTHRRHADASMGYQGTRVGYLSRVESLVGTPDQPGSLAARLAGFESALTAAAGSPYSPSHLTAAVDRADALVAQINAISDGVQTERLQADRDIARGVDLINDRLEKLAQLNGRIRQAWGGARDVSSLLDAQSQLIDDISPYMTLETRRDASGALQVFSSDGQILLDGRPAVLGFDAAGVMDPFMTDAASGLGDLTLNGRVLNMTGTPSALPGGQMSALFEVRDTWGIEAQAQIDGVARDLVERFDDSALDPTLAVGAAGLFTDSGARFNPMNEVGLARRLSLNAAVLPREGGEAWRLRDGLGATVEGPSGNAAFLHRQIDALAALQPTASGSFSGVSRTFAGLVAEQLSSVGFARQSAEIDQTHAATRYNLLREEELSHGVDTDAEMQRLLQIEQHYAANAQVVSAAQDMLDQLIGMV